MNFIQEFITALCARFNLQYEEVKDFFLEHLHQLRDSLQKENNYIKSKEEEILKKIEDSFLDKK